MAFMGILIYWIKKLLLCVMVYITVFFVGIVLLVIGIIIQNKILKIISLVIIAIQIIIFIVCILKKAIKHYKNGKSLK